MKVLGTAFGIFFAMFLMFALGYEYSQHNKPFTVTAGNGTYRVYGVQKAFDIHTGELVYWIVGGKMNNGVEPSEVVVYSMPQSTTRNLPDYEYFDQKIHSWQMQVKDGKAMLLR